MTSRAFLLATAMLTLVACGDATKSAKAAADPAATNGAAPAAAPVAPAPPSAPTQAAVATPATFDAAYMVGKWSAIGENCSGTLEFRKNGTVTTPIGEAKWTVTGDKLAIDYGDGSSSVTSSIKPLGPDRIEITHSSGTKETEKRC
jgi:hypothetical protein